MKKNFLKFSAIIFLGFIVACGAEEVPSIEPLNEEVTSEENLQEELSEESSVEKVNQEILPQEPTSIEIFFDINSKEPIYLFEDAEFMQKLYKSLQVDTWQETRCEWEIAGSEWINVFENEKRYIIEILGVDEETVLFKVTDEQNKGKFDATKYYSGATESYSDLVEQLQEQCVWPNAYESHVYLANLDGVDDLERIYIVNKSPDNSYYHAYVKNSKYEEIWSRDFGTSHVGWGAVFLCTIDEKEYLLEYSPYIGQGLASYRYSLIDFQNNERNVVAEKEVEFEVYTQDNVEERIAFMEEVNALIEQSQVIMSTLDGKAVVGLASAEEFKMTEEQLYYHDAEQRK